MTGTSLDGIDAAVVAISGHGLDMRAEVLSHAAGPLGSAEETIRQLTTGGETSAKAIGTAAKALSAQTAAVMQQAIGNHRVDFAGVHGQTVLHAPPCSWQLIDAAVIADTLSCPVASQMRGGDLAAGGEGEAMPGDVNGNGRIDQDEKGTKRLYKEHKEDEGEKH